MRKPQIAREPDLPPGTLGAAPAAAVRLHVLAESLLPPMRCDRGCDHCCTWAPCSQPEYDQVLAYAAAHGLTPRKQGMLCPWYQEGTCAVHPVRPLVCRMFGHVPELACIRGYNTNVRRAVERRLLAAHQRLCPDPEQARYLHEVAYSRAAVERMLAEQARREEQAQPPPPGPVPGSPRRRRRPH